jgi:hypothetical protein
MRFNKSIDLRGFSELTFNTFLLLRRCPQDGGCFNLINKNISRLSGPLFKEGMKNKN